MSKQPRKVVASILPIDWVHDPVHVDIAGWASELQIATLDCVTRTLTVGPIVLLRERAPGLRRVSISIDIAGQPKRRWRPQS